MGAGNCTSVSESGHERLRTPALQVPFTPAAETASPHGPLAPSEPAPIANDVAQRQDVDDAPPLLEGSMAPLEDPQVVADRLSLYR
jgi:hypothetical protein